MDEIRADGYLGVLSEDLVLEEEYLVRHGEQRDDLRIESGQTGHRCGGCCTSLALGEIIHVSMEHAVTRWVRLFRVENV